MKKAIYAVLAIIILFGCTKKEKTDSQVLAKVGDKVITLSEFNERFSSIPEAYQERFKDNKEMLLDDIILEEVLYKEALNKKVENDKDTKALLDKAKRNILITSYIKKEIDNKVAIGDKEAEEYYKSHREEFMTPQLYRASHILVDNLDDAVKIKDKLKAGADFAQLAEEYSMDVATKKKGGDVNYFTMGQMVPEFEETCATLKVGETSDVVKTQFGYHIIKLTDKKEPALMEFANIKEDVKDMLANRSKKEIFDQIVEKLKAKYKIVKHTELLGKPSEQKSSTQQPAPVEASDAG